MLILCEKPSVAKDFAEALGCDSRKGYYQNSDTIITYCIGHLFELCKPEFYNPVYKTWDISDLPVIPSVFHYERISKVKTQTDIVISLLKQNSGSDMVIATDAGREGELIARIALSEAGISDISRIKRFWVSEALTKEVILDGLQKVKPLSAYNAIAKEGFARQRTDWLIGINLTRYMTIGNTTLFSVGRVQTAVLNAIAIRNGEVAHFTPVPFNELEATLKSSNGTIIKSWLINPKTEKTAFFEDRNYLLSAQNYCRNNPVTQFQSHITKEIRHPEKLLNITGLQKAAYKLYGFSPEKTLDLAQLLYEKYKCLSYPRTPSRVMGDQNVELFKEKFALLSGKYAQYARLCDESLLSGDNKNIFNSSALEDHHALIPLNAIPEEAAADERNIFEIVLKSFFTVCMKDYVYNKKRLLFHVGSNIFRSQINEVIQYGFKEATGDNHDTDEDTQEVKKFDEKTCKIIKLEILQKETSPKKEFSIDTLLGFMENPHNKNDEKLLGLGTPSTRADIIKKLFLREYILEDRKKLFSSRKGLFLLEQLKKDNQLQKIADVAQTTEWEKQIADNPDNFENNIIQFVKNCIRKEKTETYTAEPMGLCPICGKQILEGKKNYYCTGYKNLVPCKYAIFKNILGAAISPVDIQLLLSHKQTSIKHCISKSNKKFKAIFFMEPNGNIAIKFHDSKTMNNIKKRKKV